jgi:hypothetical protein
MTCEGVAMTASAPPAAPTIHLAAAPMRNGFGIAALCCGLVGMLAGLVPIMFLASGALGIVAIVFAVIGMRRAQHGQATNRGMAIIGLGAGIGASILAIVGIIIVFSGLNTLGRDLYNATGTTSAPATAYATHVVTSQEEHMIHQDLFIGNW